MQRWDEGWNSRRVVGGVLCQARRLRSGDGGNAHYLVRATPLRGAEARTRVWPPGVPGHVCAGAARGPWRGRTPHGRASWVTVQAACGPGSPVMWPVRGVAGRAAASRKLEQRGAGAGAGACMLLGGTAGQLVLDSSLPLCLAGQGLRASAPTRR